MHISGKTAAFYSPRDSAYRKYPLESMQFRDKCNSIFIGVHLLAVRVEKNTNPICLYKTRPFLYKSAWKKEVTLKDLKVKKADLVFVSSTGQKVEVEFY